MTLLKLRAEQQRQLFLIASGVSTAGSFAGLTAKGWILLHGSAEPFVLALNFAALSLPSLVFSGPAGVRTDRIGCERVLVQAQWCLLAAAALPEGVRISGRPARGGEIPAGGCSSSGALPEVVTCLLVAAAEAAVARPGAAGEASSPSDTGSRCRRRKRGVRGDGTIPHSREITEKWTNEGGSRWAEPSGNHNSGLSVFISEGGLRPLGRKRD